MGGKTRGRAIYRGVRFMIVRSKGRALLADEPELGKTVQVGRGEGRRSGPDWAACI